MAHLNNKYYLLIVSVFVIMFFSCKQSENVIEKTIKSDFLLMKPNLDEIVMHVVDRYYTIGKAKDYNRLQFVLGDKAYNKGNIFSDTFITNRLQRHPIVGISFEKESFCLDKYAYDFVRFKLKYDVAYQYYYVYEFCPPHQDAVNSPNFKSIPLDSNWSLQVEKN